jgi:hypothetical protein
MLSKYIKIAVFVPEENADAVREALGKAGAGKRTDSNYSHCTFSTKGVGRFLPETGAEPHIGTISELAAVPEERIETMCERKRLPEVLAAMKAAHPYEEVAYEVWALEDH